MGQLWEAECFGADRELLCFWSSSPSIFSTLNLLGRRQSGKQWNSVSQVLYACDFCSEMFTSSSFCPKYSSFPVAVKRHPLGNCKANLWEACSINQSIALITACRSTERSLVGLVDQVRWGSCLCQGLAPNVVEKVMQQIGVCSKISPQNNIPRS